MAGFNFGNFSQALTDTSSPQGVSFEGQAKNWGTAEDARDVIAAIDACTRLDFLNLEGNTLGVGAADGIAQALKRHPEFKSALWKDLFTGRLKTEIPQALQSMGRGMIAAGAQLALLDCSDNALGPNGMRGLVDLLKSPTCYSLTELKLNNCGLGIEGARMLAKSLNECHTAAAAAGRPFRLRVFIAGRNRLENEGARALADVFGRVGTLEEFATPQNGINHDGIRALSEAFKQNAGLRVLNLNDNTITPRGAVGLAEAFAYLPLLREINLGDCLLKTGGAVLLGDALQDGHSELEVLNLGFNEIGPNGGMSVAAAVQNKDRLRSLVLNGNMFGQECRENISEMLAGVDRLAALGELDEDDSDNEEADDSEGHDDEDYDDEEADEEGEEGEEEDDSYGESETDEAEDHENDISAYTSAAGANASGRAQDGGAGVNFSFDMNSTVGFGSNTTALFGGGQHSNNTSALFNGANDTSVTAGDSPVDTFCLTAHPTAALFADITDADKVLAFRQHLAGIRPAADYLLNAAFAVLKCSAISKLCPDALAVSTALYDDCFAHARKTGQLARLKTFFLTQLGLVRMEDRQWRPAYDVSACRSAVRHAIGEGVLGGDVSSAFELFLERF